MRHSCTDNPEGKALRAKFALPLLLAAVVAVALWLAPEAQAQEPTANCGGAGNPLHGRTQQLVDAIVSDLSAGNCDSVTNAQLATIIRLTLSYRTLSSLQNGDFAGLTAMSTLDLNNNSLTALPADVFDGLSSLRTLNLQSNSLATLPEDVFDGPSGLQVLNLWDNSLTTLPADVLDGLSGLKTLNLYNNSLNSLPEGVLDGLSPLEGLRLDNNSLDSQNEGDDDCTALRATDRMHQNSLEWLAPGLFGGLSGLEDLDLDENSSLACIHAGQFDGLSSLEILHLQSTKLGNIAPVHGSRWGLNSLEELRFGDAVSGGLQSRVPGLSRYPHPLQSQRSVRSDLRLHQGRRG